MEKNAFFAFSVRSKKFNNFPLPHLKNPAAYYLLLIYLFALCKPAIPLVQDVVAHTFFEQEHMDNMHQHGGGGSHLKDEIGKLAEKNSSEENTGNTKSFESVPLHIAASCLFHISFQKPVIITHYSYYRYGLPSLSLAIQLPPPRA